MSMEMIPEMAIAIDAWDNHDWVFAALQEQPLAEDLPAPQSAITSKDIIGVMAIDVWDNDDLVFLALQQQPLLLENASRRLQEERSAVFAAVILNGDAFRFASDRLREDQQFISEVLNYPVVAGCLLAWALGPARENPILIAKQQAAAFQCSRTSSPDRSCPFAFMPQYDHHHAPSATSVVLCLEQHVKHYEKSAASDFHDLATRGLEFVSGQLASRGLSSDLELGRQGQWLMNQIYLILNSVHDVLIPRALQLVPPARLIRTITRKRRFVQQNTVMALGYVKSRAPECIGLNATVRWLPVLAVHSVICDLIAVASKGFAGPWHWNDFVLTSEELAVASLGALTGYLNGVAVRGCMA